MECGVPQKLYIETVGCQMNVLDSELVVGSLRRQGYELTESTDDAAMGLGSPLTTWMPYSVSMPQTFVVATARPYF